MAKQSKVDYAKILRRSAEAAIYREIRDEYGYSRSKVSAMTKSEAIKDIVAQIEDDAARTALLEQIENDEASEEIYEQIKQLEVNEDRLARLENGEIDMEPSDAVAMSKVYKRPDLRNYFCTHQCPIGKIDIPMVEICTNIHELLINMVLSLESANKNRLRLMEILSDGVVRSDEASEFQRIEEELEKMSAAIEALQLWCEKMKQGE